MKHLSIGSGTGESWGVMARFRGLLVLLPALAVALAALWFFAGSAGPVQAQLGGPVVLMGIDAEDGNGATGFAHGGKTPYIDVADDILANVSNAGSGILVIGGGKSPTDNVTGFWNAIGAGAFPVQTVTQVNGATNITNQSFAGFAIIAVASSVTQTPSGGLTNAENTALAGRASDIASHVNGGGGLFGLSQQSLSSPNYDYLGQVGTFVFKFPAQYSNVTATLEGLAVGITNTNLDVCCWHDEYNTFPSFLQVLATNNNTGKAGAIGGGQVVIQGNIDLTPLTDTNAVGTTHTVTAFAENGSPLSPVANVLVTFEVTSGPNAGELSNPNTGECSANNDCTTDANGNVSWTYTGTGGAGKDLIVATFVDQAGNIQGSNTVNKIWQVPPEGQININKVDGVTGAALADSCFQVSDAAQTPLFQVCDNDFQGPPDLSPVCVPSGLCDDEDPAAGSIRVTVDAGSFSVQESKAPAGYNPSTVKFPCTVPGGGKCDLTVLNQPLFNGLKVGGLAVDLDADAPRTPLDTAQSSGPSAGVLAGTIAGIAALAVTLSGAAWYARRRVN